MDDVVKRLKNFQPVKHYRIGEVVKYSGLSRQTVHNYTIMGLIREVDRTDGGHRLYPESVFGTLARIEEMKKQMTLREIREKLDEEDSEGEPEVYALNTA